MIKKDCLLTPSFDIEKITIPVGFYPSKKSFKEGKSDVKEERKNIIDIIVHRITEKTKQDPEDILQAIADFVLR